MGAGNVTIGAAGTLSGSGIVSGNISGSGTIAPGDPAILTLGGTTTPGSLTFTHQFTQNDPTYGNVAASGNDLIHYTSATPLSGPLTATNTVNIFLPALALVNGSEKFTGAFFFDSATDNSASTLLALSGASYQYYLFAGTGLGSVTFPGASTADYLPFLTADPTGSILLGTQYFATAPTGFASPGSVETFTVNVPLAAVPEPASWLMAMLGLAGLVWWRRRGLANSNLAK